MMNTICSIRTGKHPAFWLLQAAMTEDDALAAITINPARHLGIADRVGSLEIGKDADLVITDGCPFRVETEIKAVYINGVEVEA